MGLQQGGAGDTHDFRVAFATLLRSQKSLSQGISHRERALCREESSCGKDFSSLRVFLQSLEREVQSPFQLVAPLCVSRWKNASSVGGEKYFVFALHLRIQDMLPLTPGNLPKGGADSCCRVTSSPQVVVESTTFLDPHRRGARVR